MAIKHSPGCGCCAEPCGCDITNLDFDSDGADGLDHWYPTVDLTTEQKAGLPTVFDDLTMVSKAEVFCSSAFPFFIEADGMRMTAASTDYQDGGVLRIMARLSATVTDGIATIGDHVFADITEPASSFDRIQWFVKIGVNISGVDTVLNAGFMSPITRTVGAGTTHILRFFSMPCSSRGVVQAVYAPGNDLLQASYIMNEGDLFISSGDGVMFAESGPNLSVLTGQIFELTDADNATVAAGYTLQSDSVFTDTMLMLQGQVGGFGPPVGMSIFDNDVTQKFASLQGRHVGVRVTGRTEGSGLTGTLSVNNSAAPTSLDCGFDRPANLDQPIQRNTYQVTPTFSRSDPPSTIVYARPFIESGPNTIEPDIPYIGSTGTLTLLQSTFSINTAEHFFYKDGPFVAHNTGDDYWFYGQILLSISVKVTQSKPRFYTTKVQTIATLNLAVAEPSDWSLAEIIAGDDNLRWVTDALAYKSEVTSADNPGHTAPELDFTQSPDTENGSSVNRTAMLAMWANMVIPTISP